MARFRFYILVYGSKLGIEWDKITDAEIETNTKPKKKGIEIAYVDKDVSVEMKGKQSYYMRGSKMGIDKFTAISVLKDGKPLWYTKSWKPLTNVMTATGKVVVRGSRYGSGRSCDRCRRRFKKLRRDKQFGIEYDWISIIIISMMKIPGIKFHHINLDEDQPYISAGIKRQMRQAAQFGAAKFTTNDEFKRINQQYFDELLNRKLNDPKKLAAKVKKQLIFVNQLLM